MFDADPPTRDFIQQGVSLALAAFVYSRVLDTVTPWEGENFDPKISSLNPAHYISLRQTRAHPQRSVNSLDFQELSTLIGERNEYTDATITGKNDVGRSPSWSRRFTILWG